MIHEQEKTQLEIDEDMVRSFDKLYPDNFRLLVSPELLEGIVKKMECAEPCCESIIKYQGGGVNDRNVVFALFLFLNTTKN